MDGLGQNAGLLLPRVEHSLLYHAACFELLRLVPDIKMFPFNQTENIFYQQKGDKLYKVHLWPVYFQLQANF